MRNGFCSRHASSWRCFGQDARRPPAGLCPGRVGAAGGDAPSPIFSSPQPSRPSDEDALECPHQGTLSPGAGVVTYLARSLRGGPIKNARLVAWNGEHVITYRTRAQEYASGGMHGRA